MLGHMVLMAVMVGQTALDGPRTGPVLSEQAKKAQARALAEFRANEHTIKPRLIASYQLENDRLKRRAQTADVATGRIWSLTAGTSQHDQTKGGEGFSSVPPTGAVTASGRQYAPSLEELRRESFLLKGELRDSRFHYRVSSRLYRAEYPIRYRLAFWGVR
jgi:hypothetical protein